MESSLTGRIAGTGYGDRNKQKLTRSTSSEQSASPLPGPAAPPQPAQPHRLRRILALDEFEDAARRVIPRPIFGYVTGGAETNASLGANRAVWDEIAFVPKALVDDLRAHAQGDTLRPHLRCALRGRTDGRHLHGRLRGRPRTRARRAGGRRADDRQRRFAYAARAGPPAGPPPGFRPIFRATSAPSRRWSSASRAPGTTPWCSRSMCQSPPTARTMCAAGSDPATPTLHLAWEGIIRPRWLFAPSPVRSSPTVCRTSRTWAGALPHLALGTASPHGAHALLAAPRADAWRLAGRLVVKGVLNQADVQIAREHGIDAIIVSNHGGRQLDHAVATLRVLPGIVAAAGDMPVLMNSGVQHSTDVIEALTLGARLVFIGRPFMHAAALAGKVGVLHAMTLLREEIDRDMALLGIKALAEMRRELLTTARGPGVSGAHALNLNPS